MAFVSNTPSIMVSLPPISATPSSRQVYTPLRRVSTRGVGVGSAGSSGSAGGAEGPAGWGGMVTWWSTAGSGANSLRAAKPTTTTRDRPKRIK